jgi:hypothetical protein
LNSRKGEKTKKRVVVQGDRCVVDGKARSEPLTDATKKKSKRITKNVPFERSSDDQQPQKTGKSHGRRAGKKATDDET